MPRLWLMSDLHLDALGAADVFAPPAPAFDVLVIAGDIREGDLFGAMAEARRLAGDKPVVVVLGNHEFWNSEVGEARRDAAIAAARHGVTLLDGTEATVAGVRFVGATLWTDWRLGGDVAPAAETGEQIDVAHDGGSHLINVGDQVRLHAHDRGALQRALAAGRGGRPTVVVTHHAPHSACVPAHRKSEAGSLASDLSPLTDAGLAALWVHGHVHQSLDIARPGGTRIVCNPAGIAFENAAFRPDLVVEV